MHMIAGMGENIRRCVSCMHTAMATHPLPLPRTRCTSQRVVVEVCLDKATSVGTCKGTWSFEQRCMCDGGSMHAHPSIVAMAANGACSTPSGRTPLRPGAQRHSKKSKLQNK
jgi:hypothetical protein